MCKKKKAVTSHLKMQLEETTILIDTCITNKCNTCVYEYVLKACIIGVLVT